MHTAGGCGALEMRPVHLENWTSRSGEFPFNFGTHLWLVDPAMGLAVQGKEEKGRALESQVGRGSLGQSWLVGIRCERGFHYQCASSSVKSGRKINFLRA